MIRRIALLVGVALAAAAFPTPAPPPTALHAPAPDPCDEADEADCDASLRLPLDCAGEAWHHNGWCQNILTYIAL